MQKSSFVSLLKIVVPALAGALASVSIARITAQSDFAKAKLGVEAVAEYAEESRKADLARDKEMAEQRGRLELLEKGFVAVIGKSQPIGVGSLGTLGHGGGEGSGFGAGTGRAGSSRIKPSPSPAPSPMPIIPEQKPIPKKFDDLVQQRQAAY
jgi:hypothetical protein